MEVVRYSRLNRQGYNLRGYTGSDGTVHFGTPHPWPEDNLAGGGPGTPPIEDNSIIEVPPSLIVISSEVSQK